MCSKLLRRHRFALRTAHDRVTTASAAAFSRSGRGLGPFGAPAQPLCDCWPGKDIARIDCNARDKLRQLKKKIGTWRSRREVVAIARKAGSLQKIDKTA